VNPRYPLVAQRAAHHCEYCRAPEALFNLPFEVEHLIPPIHGGLDEDSMPIRFIGIRIDWTCCA